MYTKVWLMDENKNECVPVGKVTDWQAYLASVSDGNATVPRVFLNGQFWADRTHIEEWMNDGTLNKRLKAAGVNLKA